MDYYVNDFDGQTTSIPEVEVGYFNSWWNSTGLLYSVGNFFLQPTSVLNEYYDQWADAGKPGYLPPEPSDPAQPDNPMTSNWLIIAALIIAALLFGQVKKEARTNAHK